MKLRVMSDLHLEGNAGFMKRVEYNGEDGIVLAGDIHVGAKNVIDVLSKFLQIGFPKIFYVPGNHEYYKGSLKAFDSELNSSSLLRYMDKVWNLSDWNYSDNKINIIGDTLWTDFQDSPAGELAALASITDFRLIEDLTIQECKKRNNAAKSYLKACHNLLNPQLIVTHFLPSNACIHEKFRDLRWLNMYFANNMENWILDLPKMTWVFGHTHESMDFMLGNVRMVCNPLGYSHEQNPGFDINKVIEI